MPAQIKIVTYVSSINDDAPEAHRCIARVYLNGEVMPIIFAGPSKAAVREAAEKWWAGELDREERRRLRTERAAEGRKARVAA